jgi:hypothetical protein
MRSPLAACLTIAALVAAPVHAAPPKQDPAALAAFETGFKEGQALLDKGQPRAAAQRWKAAADLLPETTANRDMRAGIHEYIADAYTAALAGSSDLELTREAAAALTDYCDGHTRAYGTETPINPKLTAAQRDFAERRAAAEATAGPVARDAPPPVVTPTPADSPPSKPNTRPWKPLVISGGVLLGLGALSFAGAALGGLQGLQASKDYDSMCGKDDPSPPCKALYADGKQANLLVATGVVFGALLVAAGVPLLVIGMKRKKAPQQALRPSLGPTHVGLQFSLRF